MKEAIRGNQRQSEAIRVNQRQSAHTGRSKQQHVLMKDAIRGNQMQSAHTRRSKQQHVRLHVMCLREGGLGEAAPCEVVVVTHGDRERALRLVLADDEPVGRGALW
jgi:hypothetical protein